MDIFVLVLSVAVRKQLLNRIHCLRRLRGRQQVLDDCHPVLVELRLSRSIKLLIEGSHPVDARRPPV